MPPPPFATLDTTAYPACLVTPSCCHSTYLFFCYTFVVPCHALFVALRFLIVLCTLLYWTAGPLLTYLPSVDTSTFATTSVTCHSLVAQIHTSTRMFTYPRRSASGIFHNGACTHPGLEYVVVISHPPIHPPTQCTSDLHSSSQCYKEAHSPMSIHTIATGCLAFTMWISA